MLHEKVASTVTVTAKARTEQARRVGVRRRTVSIDGRRAHQCGRRATTRRKGARCTTVGKSTANQRSYCCSDTGGTGRKNTRGGREKERRSATTKQCETKRDTEPPPHRTATCRVASKAYYERLNNGAARCVALNRGDTAYAQRGAPQKNLNTTHETKRRERRAIEEDTRRHERSRRKRC